MKQTLHIITGPTAVGKTEYALCYAEACDGEIVSCDASLVYRGMNIGTAKPDGEAIARVPHHMIDLCDVDEPYDIVAFDRDARAAIRDILARGKSVVVAGGSGFYLKSFLSPVVDAVPVSDETRAYVRALYESGGLEALLAALEAKSPEGFGDLDTKNPRRVSRALERCMASGHSLLDLQADFKARTEPYEDFEKRLILLDRETESLKNRIVLRAKGMLDAGLIEEVEGLLAKGIDRNPSAASAIGYRESIAFLKGELSERELLPRIVRNTMRLVKKQCVWLRTQIREPDERVILKGENGGGE